MKNESKNTPSLKKYFKDSSELLLKISEEFDDKIFENAVNLITSSFQNGHSLLVCGNGGSASDALHITGELVGRFLKNRLPFKAICLSSDISVITAWANDVSYNSIFSRQVEAYGEPGSVILGLTTSGNSTNVIEAFESAKKLKMKTIAFTGQGGGKIAHLSDVLIEVPDSRTPMIQQAHICFYHLLCWRIENSLQ